MPDQELKQDSLPIWPNDWYVFSGGLVKGPMTAEDAFGEKPTFEGMKQKEHGDSEVLVSRKGFSQWYPRQDLAALYQLGASHVKSVTNELQKLESMLRPTPKTPGPVVTTPVVPVVPGASATMQATTSPVVAKAVSPINEPVKPLVQRKQVLPQYKGSAQKFTQKPGQKGVKTSEAQFQKTQGVRGQKTSKKSAPPETISTTRAIETKKPRSLTQEYFSLKGRFRLGRITNPFIALMEGLLSFGVYWWFWFSRTIKEVNWHMTGQYASKDMPRLWLAAIPFMHFFMTYRLADAVRKAEEQNHYRTIMPWFATVLAVFPPFTMFYVQGTLNRHWRLHVRHVMKQKIS